MLMARGVKIVTNWGHANNAGVAWQTTREPVLRIKNRPTDHNLVLFRVRGAARPSDGRLASVSEGTKNLLVFSPGGNHLLAVGRFDSYPTFRELC